MRGRHRLWIVALGALLMSLACSRSRPIAPDLIAEVGEREIVYREFESYVTQSVGESAAGLEGEVLSRLLDRFLEEEALVLLARDRGLEGSRRSLVDALIELKVRPEVDEEAIEAYYQSHPAEFRRSTRLRLLQILVPEEEVAERARAEIEGGEDFFEVANSLGLDGDTVDQGYLAAEDLPPVFAQVVERLEPGETSEVVEADYGFHLLHVVEKLPQTTLSLDQSRESIRSRLERNTVDRVYRRLVEEARGRYDLAIYEQNLPFDYLPPAAD